MLPNLIHILGLFPPGGALIRRRATAAFQASVMTPKSPDCREERKKLSSILSQLIVYRKFIPARMKIALCRRGVHSGGAAIIVPLATRQLAGFPNETMFLTLHGLINTNMSNCHENVGKHKSLDPAFI